MACAAAAIVTSGSRAAIHAALMLNIAPALTQLSDLDLIATVARLNELIRGKRGITPETAWLLASALNTTPEFWINLQAACDLARSRPAQPVERLAAAG